MVWLTLREVAFRWALYLNMVVNTDSSWVIHPIPITVITQTELTVLQTELNHSNMNLLCTIKISNTGNKRNYHQNHKKSYMKP
jgi:hypothetical protein